MISQSEPRSDATLINVKAALGLNTVAPNILAYVEDHSVLYGCGSLACVYNTQTKEHKIVPITQHHGNTSYLTCITVSNNSGLIYIGEFSSPVATLSILEPNTYKRKKMFTIPEIGSHMISLLSVSSDDRMIAIVGGPPDYNLVLFSFEKAGKVITTTKISSLFPWPSCRVADVSICPTDSSFVLLTVCPEGVAGAMASLRMFKLTENQFRAVSINSSGTSYNFTCSSWVLNEKIISGTAGGKIVYFETFEHGRLLPLPADLSSCSTTGIKRLSNGFLASFSNGKMYVFGRAEIDNDVSPFTCTMEVTQPANMISPITCICVNSSEDAITVSNGNQQILSLLLTSVPTQDKSSQLEESKLRDDYMDRIKSVEMKFLVSEFHSIGDVVAASDLTTTTTDVNQKPTGILDIDTAHWKPLVVTCGNDRYVRVWRHIDSTCLLSLQFHEEAAPSSCSFHPSGFFIAVSCLDKIQIFSVLLNELNPTRDVHIRAANQVRFSHGGHIIATCQSNIIYLIDFYESNSMTTLRGHNSRVRCVLWTRNDMKLVSASTDGNIMIWNTTNGHVLKQISCCRVTVMNACLSFDEDEVLLISSNGQVKKVNIDSAVPGVVIDPRELPISAACSGQIKCISESEFVIGNQATNSLSIIKKRSNDDYDVISTPIHISPISSISMSKNKLYLICGDRQGCLSFSQLMDSKSQPMDNINMNTIDHSSRSKDVSDELSNELLISLGLMGSMTSTGLKNEVTVDEILVSRKESINRSMDIVDLNRKVDELSRNNEYQLTKKKDEFDEKIRELTEGHELSLAEQAKLYDQLKNDKKNLQCDYAFKIDGLVSSQGNNLLKLSENYEKKIRNESNRYEKLKQEKAGLLQLWDDERLGLIHVHVTSLNSLTETYDKQVLDEENIQGALREKIGLHLNESEQYKRLLDDDVNREIHVCLADYHGRIDEEEKCISRLSIEHHHTLESFNVSVKQLDEQKISIGRLKGDELKLIDSIRTSEKDIQTYKREIREREEAISEKERKVVELKNKNQELEKFKFVLDYKIRELKRQIDPREEDIGNSKNQLDEMNAELCQYESSKTSLCLLETELKMKLQAMNHEYQSYVSQIDQMAEQLVSIRRQGTECLENMSHYKTLKSMIIRLFKRYCEKDSSNMSSDAVMSEEETRKRIRDQLERNLEALTSNRQLGVTMFTRETNRMTREQDELIEDMNGLKKEARLISSECAAVEFVMASQGSPDDVKAILGDSSIDSDDVALPSFDLTVPLNAPSSSSSSSSTPPKTRRKSRQSTGGVRSSKQSADGNNGLGDLEPWKELNRLKGIVESLQEEVTDLCNQLGEDPLQYIKTPASRDMTHLRDGQVMMFPPLAKIKK